MVQGLRAREHVCSKDGDQTMVMRRQGGLSGRARTVRDRSRAARTCAAQRIVDYLEPEAGPRRDLSRIPIGRQAGYLHPTVAVSTAAATGIRHPSGQLELSLTPADLTDLSPRRPVSPVTSSPQGVPLAPAWLRLHDRSSKRGFTMGGFLCGCAIGGAVAAAILLVVQTVIW